VLVIQGASTLLNGTLSADRLAAQREDDPEAAIAEQDGLFRVGLSSALASELIEFATDSGITERSPVLRLDSGIVIARRMFIDAAGGSGRDSYTAAIAHHDGEQAILDTLLEVRPPFSTEEASVQVAELARRYGITTVTGDRYGGDWPMAALARHGIGYTPAAKAKSDIYGEAIPLFTSRRVRLLDNARLIAQLRQLERRARPGGRDLIDHPRGAHDDAANAALGALWLVARASVACDVSLAFTAQGAASSSADPASPWFNLRDALDAQDAGTWRPPRKAGWEV
jgi:hypothetical protein